MSPSSSRLTIPQLPVSLTTLRTPTRLTNLTKPQFLTLTLDLLRTTLLLLFLLRLTTKTFLQLRGYGLVGTATQFYRYVRRRCYTVFLRLPFVAPKVKAELDKTLLELEKKLVPTGPGVKVYSTLPEQGWSVEDVRGELDGISGMEHTSWETGRVSGAVYHGGAELAGLQEKAFGLFGVSNPIHPDVFPGVRKMEAEVVAMVGGLFNAPAGGAGVSTSGGTESILMACLAARQKALAERGVREPEMVVPETGHAAFRKAGEYFGIKVHLVACPAPSYRVHIPSVARLINSNTVLLVGSAPNFPHGIIDDIPALSRLALKGGKVAGAKGAINLHVDCCLGSFLMPFLARTGFPCPEFDFRVPGVTSISVDTHKYGFAPKGNSVVVYRTKDLRRYQYYVCPDWSGGVYASPGIAGSRPGALIAGCWASLMRMGADGYGDTCLKIVSARQRIEDAVREHEGLRHSLAVVGKPLVSVLAFHARPAASPENRVDIYDVADGMSRRGWHLNALQDPAAMHVAVTLPIVAAVEDLVRDLELVVGECRGKVQEGKKGDAAALYGVAGALPDKSIVRELAGGFLDTLYKT
ncbi:hypothetical protein LTR62_002496 [Meristemomyces frigidus]|uniref:sphinganine-1-phosphate aldolase n=1 Tax=Meristemomyces frigidus TaxID=1508187 RepID=A0AAN7T8D5_9PEZI|nr:hypothetical protein LTR62_002496 [Meristemomyces frigidus]